MNNQMKSKLASYYLVRDVLSASSVITATLPNFTVFNTAFSDSMALINTHSEFIDFDQSGITVNKEMLRHNLETLVFDTKMRLYIYAKFVGNHQLITETQISETAMKRIKDFDFRNFSQGIYDRAQANLADLSTYGITAATQIALLNAINAWVAVIHTPQQNRKEHKQTLLLLNQAFDTAEAALKNIDDLVKLVKKTQPAFYESYTNSRKVVMPRGSNISVIGEITSADNTPLKNASLAFQPILAAQKAMAQEGETSLRTWKTAEKGRFRIKNLPDGRYNVIVSKAGFSDQIVQITVAKGETVKMQVQLPPA